MKKTSPILAALFFLGLAEAHESEATLQWSQEKRELANIQLKVAGPGEIHNSIEVSGIVQIHQDHLAYVISKVNGSVYAVYKNLGDEVAKGEVLAKIESPEIAEAKAYYLTSQKKFELQRTLLEREEKLVGISSGEDYLHAKWEAKSAEIDLQLAAQRLYAIGYSEEDIAHIAQEGPEGMRFFSLRSPFKGTILERNLIQGEMVDALVKGFLIGNFDQLCVEIQVPQSDACNLKRGLPVAIHLPKGGTILTTISHFSPALSQQTRTATALAIVNNSANQWAPGQFITAEIQTDKSQAAIVVPRQALQLVHGKYCIFVESGERLIPSIVRLGKKDRENVEIVSGLDLGASYVASNTFCLKADLEKEEGDHGH